MEYLQLKHSVEQLTECLKIMPKEDRLIVKQLVKKYQDKLKSIDYLDETNEFFDDKELRHINCYMSNFKNKLFKPFEDEIERIQDEISEKSGFDYAYEKSLSVYQRIDTIAAYYCAKKHFRWTRNYQRKIHKQIESKSKVYKNVERECESKREIFYQLLDESRDFQEAEKQLDEVKAKFASFDIDLKLKNMIAYKSRNMESKAITSTGYAVIREIISTEIERQWINFTTFAAL